MMETRQVRLTEVCNFQGGSQPPKQEWVNEPREGYVRMLQIRDFTQGKEEYIAYVRDSKKVKKCNVDDVLIGRYGASVGKILTGLEGAYNVAMIKTIPDEKQLDRQFLYYLLKSTSFQKFILSIGSRAAQAGFNKADLENFRFQLPISLDDQKQIAHILGKAEALIQQREKSIALADEFLKFKFWEMFGSETDYPQKILNEVCLKITDGTHQSPKFVESGIPFLLVSNIVNNEIDYNAKKFISEEVYQTLIKRTPIEIGDILITTVGSYGNPAIVQSDKKFCFQRHIGYLKPNHKIVNYRYLFAALLSPVVQRQIDRAVVGVAQKTLNLSALKSLLIPIPPLEIQKEFSELVIAHERLRSHLLEGLVTTRNLFSSISNKALSGEFQFSDPSKVIEEEDTPKKLGETKVIEKLNQEIEDFHHDLPHSGAPEEIDQKIRQLDTELKLRGEIPFWEEYVKYRLVKGKFKEPFVFEALWMEITQFPFETTPDYDAIKTLVFDWLKEDEAFLQQRFNEQTKKIELTVNETA